MEANTRQLDDWGPFSRDYPRYRSSRELMVAVPELSQCKRLNPKGNIIGESFADYMGVDGTTIWAAATSGPDAIPVLLLLVCWLEYGPDWRPPHSHCVR